MLWTIANELARFLKAHGCPLRVIYGPERRDVALSDPRIVIERDRSAGDSVIGARGQRRGKLVDVRSLGCQLRVFAKSSVSGADVHDHERQVDQAIDLCIVGLREVIMSELPAGGSPAWMGKVGPTLWKVTRAGLLTADDLALRGLQTWPGVVYEMAFTVDRGVADTTWQGDSAAEVSLGSDGLAISAGTLVVTGDGGSTASGDLPAVRTELGDG